ncbi:MAG: hypothetical protein UT31_C0005G0007 [Parcubacteria group bacterium GW2011_GWF2_39_13b]|nr:MAG: hypothetical protein UT31_C0005G0007 [Parcubacteria group bacterium GW2011_GWF2_39_13b]
MEGLIFKGAECAHCGLKQDVVIPVKNCRTEDQGEGHIKNIYYLEKAGKHICSSCGSSIVWINDRTSLNCIKKG